MTEVRVDITGDASGLNSVFDDVTRRAQQMGVNLESLASNVSSGNKTSSRRQMEQSIISSREERERGVTEAYNSDPRVQRHSDLTQRMRTGQMTPQERAELGRINRELQPVRQQRDQELERINSETNEILEEIREAFTQRNREEREQKQRDDEEFEDRKSRGLLGQLMNERDQLNKNLITAESEEEQKRIQNRLKEVNKQITATQGGAAQDPKGDIVGNARMVSGIMGGNMGGAAMGMLSKLGPWGMAAGIVGGATLGLGLSGNNLLQSIYGLRAFKGASQNEGFVDNFRERTFGGAGRDLATLGFSQKELVDYTRGMATQTGTMDKASDKAFDAMLTERAFGVQNLQQFSVFERQNRDMQSIANNTLEMINVLSSIDKSGIKPDDLTQLQEKLTVQNKIMSYQFQKQESVSTRESTALMAAFSRLGGSGSDQRAGDFISGTLGAFGEGGDPNMMAYKFYLAKKARPELRGNPAALSKMIEEGTDLQYVQTGLTDLTTRFQGQDLYFMMKKFFPNLTPEQRDKLVELGRKGMIMEEVQNFGKSSKGFDKDDVETLASNNVSEITRLQAEFNNTMGEFQLKVAQGMEKAIAFFSGDGDSMSDVIAKGVKKAGGTNPQKPNVPYKPK
jgi:hypothetical protein